MNDTRDDLDADVLAILQRNREIANDRMLRLPQAKAMIGSAASTMWKGVKEGTLPPPISLGPRTVAWRESELQAWIDVNTYASRAKRRIDMKQFIALLIAL